MKVIITESQYNFLKKSILLESKDDSITYTTKYDHRLFRWDDRWDGMNYSAWQNVPSGTKFKYFSDGYSVEIQAWNGSLRFLCSKGLFYARQYVFKDEVLTKALKNKFCSGKGYKEELFNVFDDKKIEGDLSKVQDQTCVNKIKSPYLNAFNWWKNKLNEPSFYSKLKKLNNYTDQQTKDWIGKYKNYLSNNISGPFCPTKNSKYYKEHFEGKRTIAHLAGHMGTSRVVYNITYQNESLKDIEATMVHEIQHALYDLKPMTPHENWKKVFPYKVWNNSQSQNSKVSISKEKNTILKYGLNEFTIEWWKLLLQSKKLGDDPGYVCRETELASRMVGIKNLLKYSTSQKITVSDFKKFIDHEEYPYNDENVYWLVLCWVNNGMEDIQTFLDKLDKYVVAKVEPKKGDDMKDQLT
jgi:hypothetical protein